MKSEDDLFREMKDSLAAFTASRVKMQPVDAVDFPHVDLRFYDDVTTALAGCGFACLGDHVPVTGHGSDGTMRCFVRAFLSSDGLSVAACYHPRPRFWMALISRLIAGRLGKVIEFETEFGDDTWIITTTAPRARLFDPPPLLLREHHAETTQVASLYRTHKERLTAYLRMNPGLAVRAVRDVSGLERSQARQHDIVAVYREMVGGLTAEEIRRFSIFGRTRSKELKSRLDSM